MSDEGKDAPICLVAHNKLKYISKHPTTADKEFLSYRGEVRDISIVDEAFNDAEATYVDQHLLVRALRNTLMDAEQHTDAAAFMPLIATFGPLFKAIEAENLRRGGCNAWNELKA